MTICNGCGGVVGRDCFNQSECEWIARDMEQRATAEAIAEPIERDIESLLRRVNALEAKLKRIESMVDGKQEWLNEDGSPW